MNKKAAHSSQPPNPNFAIVKPFTLVAAFYCALFAIIFLFVVKNQFLFFVHLLACISVVTNYLVLQHTQNFDKATTIILSTGTAVVTALFATGGWDNTGYLWPFAYLPFAFFLTKGKKAGIWVFVLCSALVLVLTLHLLRVITIPYSSAALINYYAALAIYCALMMFYRKAAYNHDVFIQKQMELEMKTAYIRENERRTNAITEALLKTAMLDFTSKMEISDRGDELDAIAIGLNMVSEELEAHIKIVEESKKRFEHMLEHAPEAVIVINGEGIISEWNPKAELIFNWQKTEVVGRYLHEIIIPQRYHDSHIEGLKKYLLTGAGNILNKTIELSAIRKDTSEFDVGLSISPFDYKGGKFFIGFISDITERKTADEKIRQLNAELEQRVEDRTVELKKNIKEIADYKYAIDESSIVAITDQKGIIKHANDNFCKISKFSYQELIGQDHRIINSGEHPKEFIRSLWTTIANGKIWRGELKNKAKDGTAYWVDTTIVPFLNEEKKPYQYVAIRSDITDRKKLEEQNALYTSIISSTDDAVISKDFNGIITSWNKGAEKMFGYSLHEALGKHIFLIIPPHLQGVEEEISARIKRDEVIDYFETQRITRNGEMIHVGLSISPIKNLFGNIIGVSKISRNITKRIKAEQTLIQSETKFRKIFESKMMGIIFWNKDGGISETNDRFLEMTGYSRQDFNLGIVHWQKMTPPEYNALDELAFKQISKYGVCEPFEKEYIRKDGSRIPIFLAAATLGDTDPTKGVAFIIDNTERKKAEENVRILNEELEMRVKDRTEELESFTYSVSHDLRSPLRAVNGYANILEEDYRNLFDEEGKRLLGEVQNNAKKMGILIDDLLSFSRLGKQEVVKTIVDMNELAGAAIREVAHNDKNKTVIKANNLLPVEADYNLLLQVMINLISNAVKYSSQKEKPVVEIQSKPGKNEIIYSIRDNGVGFDMQYAHKLFGVFQRLHSSEEFPGTGVGLAIVNRIINKHRGKIWAEAEINEGATFYFSLPAKI